MSLTYGSLFAGYGGLEMGVQSILGGRTLWHAEFDKAPSRILEHHYPGVPNLGDVTKVDWASVPKVDVITGGSPCQDLSHAGKRKGMTDGTRSNLWVEMREAVAVIRPRLVVWENVRGALSAPADSDLEPCPGCVGDGDDGPVLRALGRVLGDLAELGYDARWYGLRAADVGAAHGRFRVFLFATPADDARGLGGYEAVEHDGRGAQAVNGSGVPHESDRDPLRAGPDGGLTLLPTPAVNDMGAAYTPETWDAWTERMKASHGNGNGHGKSLAIEAQRLLPTPRTSDTNGAGVHGVGGPDLRTVVDRLLPTPRATRGGSSTETRDRLLPTPTTADHKASGAKGYGGNEFCTLTDATVRNPQDWREYEAAIRRHEAALGRPAPAPTEPGAKGQPRLSPRFVEFLMMLPAGWVTDVPGISRNDMLKALGNGVVVPQAAAATRAFIRDTAWAVAS